MDSGSEDEIFIKRRHKKGKEEKKEQADSDDFEELENLINQNAKDDELDEEDLFLIAENKKHRKRARLEDSDEDAQIKKSKDSDMSDFIVDDVGAGASEEEYYEDKKVKITRDDGIFGADFEYEEIEALVKPTQKAINILDPTELAQSHLTKYDQELCLIDVPERFLTRQKKVEKADSSKLSEEAAWIYEYGFNKIPIYACLEIPQHIKSNKYNDIIQAIKNILDLIRNQNLEPTFITNYRKETYKPYLIDEDINKIFDMDNEYMRMLENKQKLVKLITQLHNFQTFLTNKDEIDIGAKIDISEVEVIESIFNAQDLRDYQDCFSRHRLSKLRSLNNYIESKYPADYTNLKIVDFNEYKSPQTFNLYDYCKKNNILGFLDYFGISASEIAENLKENFPKFVPKRNSNDPHTIAHQFISKFVNESAVIDYSIKLFAEQLYNPIILSECRKFVFSNAKISCHPTPAGLSQIDYMHPYSDFKYLKNKPIEIFKPEQYLQLVLAQQQGLINFEITVLNSSNKSFIDVCRPFFERDESVSTVQQWNSLRLKSFSIFFNDLCLPKLTIDLKNHLFDEAQRYIFEISANLMRSHLNISADSRKLDSTYVFSISLPNYQVIRSKKPTNINDGFCAVIASDGTHIETFTLDAALLVSRNRTEHAENQVNNSITTLLSKINQYKPLSIVLSLTSKIIKNLALFLESKIADIAEDRPKIEIINCLIPNLAAKSTIYKKTFNDMSSLEKQAISAGRYSIDPLLELAQLFEYPDDITSIFINQYNCLLSKDSLYLHYSRVLMDVVCVLGVDIHRCINDYRYANLLKYVAGFGPAKATNILMKLRERSLKIRSRTELIEELETGPNVFVNCAGFLKIPADIEIDEDIEPFDTTRIHPESYNFAREILACAFESTVNEIRVNESMLELLIKPKILQNIDYDKFKQISDLTEDKSITLEDIKAELCSPYEDKRSVYHTLTEDEQFWILGTNGVYFDREFMKDALNPMALGNIISGTVSSYQLSKPSQSKIREMVYQEESTGTYTCPFCKEKTFDKLDEVLQHCDHECTGLIIGVRINLENGLFGFIPRDNITIEKKDSVRDKLQIGMTVNARIVNINEKKLSVELSYKSNETFNFKLDKSRDKYFDALSEKMDLFKQQEEKEKLAHRVIYHKKLIMHPLFKNLTYLEADDLLKKNSDMDCIIRPSSKGSDHLTATIRIHNDIFVHVDIKEEQKSSDYTLGKKLIINEKTYEDLDEIYACYITPMLNFIAKATSHKCYAFFEDKKLQEMQVELKKRLETAPNQIPYLMSISTNYPGKLFIAYLQKSAVKMLYVSVNDQGYRTRDIIHPSIESVLVWFKNQAEKSGNQKQTGAITPRYEDMGQKYTTPMRQSLPMLYSDQSPSVNNWRR